MVSLRMLPAVATIALIAALGADAPAQMGPQQGASPCTSSIRVLFNQFGQTHIPAGSTIWFSGVLEGIQSAGTRAVAPLRIDVRQSRITFGLWPYVIDMPDSTITIDPAAGAPQRWWVGNTSWSVTYAPAQVPEAFFDGMPYRAPEPFIPGHSGPVTWTATFSASRPGVTVRWAWSAAAYSQFGANGGSSRKAAVRTGAGISKFRSRRHAGALQAVRRCGSYGQRDAQLHGCSQ
jgi:hypothetical protein